MNYTRAHLLQANFFEMHTQQLGTAHHRQALPPARELDEGALQWNSRKPKSQGTASMNCTEASTAGQHVNRNARTASRASAHCKSEVAGLQGVEGQLVGGPEGELREEGNRGHRRARQWATATPPPHESRCEEGGLQPQFDPAARPSSRAWSAVQGCPRLVSSHTSVVHSGGASGRWRCSGAGEKQVGRRRGGSRWGGGAGGRRGLALVAGRRGGPPWPGSGAGTSRGAAAA